MNSRLTDRSGLILIVDDTPTNLSLLAQVLGDAGFEVAIATTGERAIEQVQRERPDLILLDIMMPGIGGLETCRRLKTDAHLKTIPVIFMTALTGVEHKVKALDAGGIDYITKPFQEKEVVERVAIHLELYKTRLELAQSERRIENVLNSLQEVVWSAYLNPFEIIYLNPSVESIYGLSPQALMDEPQQWIDRIVEEDAHLLRSHLFGVSNGESFELEYRVVGLHGNAHWLQCSAKVQLEESTQRFRVDGILSDNTARKLAEQKLVHAAQRDSLTSLANRAFFIDKLNQSLAEIRQQSSLTLEPSTLKPPKLALLFIDLDRFKTVNDSLGHGVGDKLLIQVTHRLLKAVRSTDLLARLGGDEFTILLRSISSKKDVLNICDRIQELLALPLTIDGYAFTVTASIGVVISSELYTCAHDMLRAADIAMYEAKRRGRARHQLYSQQMYEKETHKLSLENELRHALKNREIFMEYQPILALKTEKLSGFEALMRWRHPELGLISPGEFIPLAEEIGLINEMGEYALQESCLQMHRWIQTYPEAAALTININVSSHQLETDNFLTGLEATLRQTQLDPKNIKLEVTETSLIKNTQNSWENLSKLKDKNIRISLDDFGTGYSSLSYLIKFPVDTLKIDRSFISTMEHNQSSLEIVRAVITLARTLGMVVVAEGLEDVSQGLVLKELGCDLVQGYLFSKPLSVEKATDYIQFPRHSVLSAGLAAESYQLEPQLATQIATREA